MPLTQVITVISPASWVTCGPTEVVEVAGSACCLIFMVAGSRVCSSFVTSPGRVVAVLEVFVRCGGVGIVACGKDGTTLYLVEQPGRSLISGAGAIGYVPAPTRMVGENSGEGGFARRA